MRRGRTNDGIVTPDEAHAGSGATAVMDDPSSLEEDAPRDNIFKRLANLEITPDRVPRKELMHFSRQLGVFIKAGIPLLEAIDGITEEMSHKKFKEVLLDVRERVATGQTLTAACAEHPEAFPRFYVGMLRTAELSGTLDLVLDQLAGYIERDLDARRKVTSALLYPGIIAVVGVAVVVVMVVFVLPRFKTFFESLDAKLPLPTRMLLGFTNFTTHYWYLFALLAVIFLSVIVWMLKHPKGRDVRDKLLLKAPALGDLVQHIMIERFCRIMSSMLQAGVPLPEAMAVTADATGNVVFRRGLEQAREEMVHGGGLAAPLAATELFPPAARQMMRVGEDTGTLDQQLETAAEYYGRELEYKIKRFTSLFEPAVIVLMGVVVGFVAIALVSAMYGIFNQVHP